MTCAKCGGITAINRYERSGVKVVQHTCTECGEVRWEGSTGGIISRLGLMDIITSLHRSPYYPSCPATRAAIQIVEAKLDVAVQLEVSRRKETRLKRNALEDMQYIKRATDYF
jgi:hypothetical protein